MALALQSRTRMGYWAMLARQEVGGTYRQVVAAQSGVGVLAMNSSITTNKPAAEIEIAAAAGLPAYGKGAATDRQGHFRSQIDATYPTNDFD